MDDLTSTKHDHSQNSHHLEDPVIIKYQDLMIDPENATLIFHPLFSKAFGGLESSNPSTSSNAPLGLIAISGIPSFVNQKQNLFQKVYKLANLPDSYLETNLTDPRSMYNAGWSRGKEKLGDKPDQHKASFYFNPVTDLPGSKEDREQYPTSYPCNLWPENSLVEGFKDSATGLGCLMKKVVAMFAGHLDVFVRNCHINQMEKGKNSVDRDLENLKSSFCMSMGKEMKQTEKVKGRILYYFPLPKKGSLSSVNKADSWIGWHCDSGFLTALAGDAYLLHETGEFMEPNLVDPQAGLHVLDRNSVVRKINIPQHCMGIQIGECLQILSGGMVVATPHCVKGADPNWMNSSNECEKMPVARISFPCFIDTVPSFSLSAPKWCPRNEVLKKSIKSNKIPPLEKRWINDGMAFGEFLQKTFSMYYDWSLKV